MTERLAVAEIAFVVDGAEHPLAPPTPRIGFAVSRQFGGLDRALEAVHRLDLDACAELLAIVWPEAPKTRAAREEFVFAHLQALFLPLMNYVLALQRGGRPPARRGEDDAPAGGNGAGKADRAQAAGS